MKNLSKSNNIYADLAQSTYNTRPKQFPFSSKKWSDEQKRDYSNYQSVLFDFKKAKDMYGNDVGKLYLQPDPG